ncbi:MAG: DNA internalization-related competence protein ComEC/Rec2 [Phascolarctobacterium sp.]|uniref:DNA internalization-related competence protein ComEC/Rec2 n=1 Tax=Phascolarctobacterium sp. TaxID=2049039 RepID=UPI0026DC9386|nr:DNA internalization-related competence protein ComEC/Rec2 [Phascolarctobacterium sp.]MDO4922119.1 DNA internalization-related competence protein ComEC/Rec2 [Phascolarctobacterium sp.]
MQFIYAGMVCFMLGLWLGLQPAAAFASWPLLSGAAAAALALGVRLTDGWRRGLCVCLSLLLLGWGNGCRVELSAAQQLEQLWGRQAVAYGKLEPLSLRQDTGYQSFILQCEQLRLGAELRPYRGRLRVGVRQKEILPECGRLTLAGQLEPLTGFRNPGAFDSEQYHRVNGLGGRLKNAKLLAAQEEAGWRDKLELLNLRLCRRLERGAGGEAGAVLGGMLLGGSGRLDDETREVFIANGLAHLLSVSGTHLVLLASLLSALLKPLPLKWRRLLLVLLLCAYAALCGGRPPVLRALLMSTVVLFGGAGAERGRLLCLTAMSLLLFKPVWLADIGFQLSFGAAAGLVWLLPACRRCLPAWLPTVISEGAAVTLAAQLGVLPFIVGYFHQLSVISLVSNIVLVPLLELAALLGLAGCALPLGDYLLAAAGFLVRQALTQGAWLSCLPGSVLTVGALPLWCAVIYYGLLAVWADWPCLQFLRNWERRCLMTGCVLLLSGALLWQQYGPRPLAAYFLDVGQGDCVVVVTPSRKVAVYDTGGLSGIDTGAKIVAPFLRSLGFSAIDLLIVSHYDFDHAGGAAGLLRQMPVKEIVLPQERLTEASAAIRQKIIAAAGAGKISLARQGRSWQFEDSLLRLAVPAEQVVGNEASTLAELFSPYGSLLLTGDMGEEREQNLALGCYTVLKAGHHGSKYSSSAEFLQQVQPLVTVISCGRGNRYGHPHAETMERLRAAGSRVLRTDAMGCIKIEFAEELRCWAYDGKAFRRLQNNNL